MSLMKMHAKSVIAIWLVLIPALSMNAQESGADSVKENTIKTDYSKFQNQEVVKKEGLFTVYQLNDKTYFEIPDTLMGRDMLLGSRVADLSNSSKVSAGEMRKQPVLIRFTRNEKSVFMHQVVSSYLAATDDPVKIAVDRTSVDPVLQVFNIEAINIDSSAAVIDVTKFFSEEINAVSPFNAKFKAGKLEKDATWITEVLSFPKNVEVRTRMGYSNTSSDPFTILMHRSLLLLPETPMKPRYEDDRIGYFSNSKLMFSTDTIGVASLKYISRFNIQPAEEDYQDWLDGKLVEPVHPIVFYVDNAFPEEWRKYIKQGVEDWQIAFESFGFKNAIIARNYPLDDPTFHPEDIRYSCVRYISSPKANSMGPRWIDPRSGEVISGDMLWWHNVTELLRDWRFVQCAAADPEARKRNPDMDMLGEMIRYVAAHEVGHTLGLKHNMRASYAFPVDSLRSSSFTQKNGTTPSIMDYARFNYIAQPGDEGIRYTPPAMGPYDIYAIKWGYCPIADARSPEDEYATLNRWIMEKKGDPVYSYGDQQMGAPNLDPSSQNEALGDDAVRASTYGVKNARYIMDHLYEWTVFENEDFEYLNHMYEELIKQYNRYLGHVVSYIGGVYIEKLVGGEEGRYYNSVSREKQKEALNWLFDELDSQPQWIINEDVERVMASKKMDLLKMQSASLDKIMSAAILQRLFMYHSEYTCEEYLEDIHSRIWARTIKNQVLNEYERNLQVSYVRNLLSMTGSERPSELNKPQSEELSSGNSARSSAASNLIDPLLYKKIRETKSLLEKKSKSGPKAMRPHYMYLLDMLN